MKRQWLPYGMEWDHEPVNLRSNPKLDFAREMQKMEGELSVLTGKAREQRCYDLAVRYAQASLNGDCWFLLHDGKSAYGEVGSNEVDFTAKAVSYLRQAGETKDFLLKEKVLFAQSYAYLNPDMWYTVEWDSQTYEQHRKPVPQSAQYKAFAALLNFEQKNASRTSRYVSNCDEYLQFKEAYN